MAENTSGYAYIRRTGDPAKTKEAHMNLTTDQRLVLRLLEGCPCGATDYCLTSRFGVRMDTMVELAKAKLVSVREHGLAHGGRQCWVGITPAGIKALEASKKDMHQKVRDVLSLSTPTVHDLIKDQSK
jgi:hypothetical protein